VKIGSLSLAPIAGLDAEDVVVTLSGRPEGRQPGGPSEAETPKAQDDTGRAGTPGGEEKKPPDAGDRIEIDRLSLSFGVLRYLFTGAIAVDVDADLLGGGVRDARFYLKGSTVVVNLGEVEGLSLGKQSLLTRLLGSRVSGKLDAEGKVRWRGSIDRTDGRIKLTVSDAKLHEPRIKTQRFGEFYFTDMAAGTIEIEAAMGLKAKFKELGARGSEKSRTVILFGKVSFSGGDIEAVIEDPSTIQFDEKSSFGAGRLNVRIAFQFKERFFDKSVERDGAMEQPNRALRTALTMDPRFKAAQKDGMYGLLCKGTVASPSCHPTKPLGKGRSMEAEEPDKEPSKPGPGAQKAKPKAPRPEPRRGSLSAGSKAGPRAVVPDRESDMGRPAGSSPPLSEPSFEPPEGPAFEPRPEPEPPPEPEPGEPSRVQILPSEEVPVGPPPEEPMPEDEPGQGPPPRDTLGPPPGPDEPGGETPW
jgi:type II secretion system protein N